MADLSSSMAPGRVIRGPDGGRYQSFFKKNNSGLNFKRILASPLPEMRGRPRRSFRLMRALEERAFECHESAVAGEEAVGITLGVAMNQTDGALTDFDYERK